MRVEVLNFGLPRTIPTCQGNIFIPRQIPVPMNLKELAAQELDAMPNIHVNYLDRSDEDKERRQPKIDYSKYPIWDLRSIAASLKVKGFFTMKKVDLIKKLEENNGTST